MKFQTATDNVINIFDGKQDPDEVKYIKQWDEFARLKGWLVHCQWDNGLTVTLDMTLHYTRFVSDLDKAPDYKPGKH